MKSQWSNKVASQYTGLQLLVYASRLIGSEPRLVLWGGGNSSAKIFSTDHTGRSRDVLWIKGSGSDMRTITATQFAPLRLDELLPLKRRPHMSDDDMVAYQARCLMDPASPKPSIETLLHAFIPARHVYHTHADAICTLTSAANGRKLMEKVYGRRVAVVPYVRPGFTLAKLVAEAYEAGSARLDGIILDRHGLVTWGDTAREAYLRTIDLVTDAERYVGRATQKTKRKTSAAGAPARRTARHAKAAEIAAILRGAISSNARVVLEYDDTSSVLDFLASPNAEAMTQLGPFTPDHMLHTKPTPLFIDVITSMNSPVALERTIRRSVEQYRIRYVQYFKRYAPAHSIMLDPFPRVIIIPGIGVFTSGKDRKAARIAHDLYCHTIEVIRATNSIDTYTALSSQELCDFEYWPMENFKLTLLPPEKPLSRRIALITGGAGAIGKATAHRLASQGACVALADLDQGQAEAVSAEVNARVGSDATVPIHMDVTNPRSVAAGFQKTLLTFGGLDILVSNAGVAWSASIENIAMHDWNKSFAVNATGHLLVCQEAVRLFKKQQVGGSIVVIATKNVFAPGKDFAAYSASKAAQTQLSRVLALEGGQFGIRVNMVNPDAVFEGSGIWSKELRRARAKSYGIHVEHLEDYCASRNILGKKISADDVAAAVEFLASDKSSKTTGAVLPVDGGVKEAFPR